MLNYLMRSIFHYSEVLQSNHLSSNNEHFIIGALYPYSGNYKIISCSHFNTFAKTIYQLKMRIAQQVLVEGLLSILEILKNSIYQVN